MTIRSIARSDVVSVDDTATIVDIATTMADERVGSVVVMDGADPVGIITDRDLALDVLGAGIDPADYTAQDLVRDELWSVDADDGIFEVIDAMAEVGYRRVPVMEGTELVGIVTLDDLLVLLANEFQDLARIVQAESPPYEAPDLEMD